MNASSEAQADEQSAKDFGTRPPPVYSVNIFSKRNPAFSPSSVRALLFKADSRYDSKGRIIPGNGLIESGAVLRLGRKVLIDEERFFIWLRSKQALQQ
ncbi:MAG: hypothetical protein ACLPXB_03925 [Thiobacillaceae bacterium]